MSSFSALCAVGGVAMGCALLFAAAPRAGVLLTSASGLLAGLALGRVTYAVHAAPEWLAMLIVLGAAAVLSEGRFRRLMYVAVPPITAAAALAAAAILEIAWVSVPLSIAGVAGAWLVGCAGGYALSHVRHRVPLIDAALLALLIAFAMMTARTALIGWQRAAIAAEGDDSPALEPTLWVLVPVGAAFVSGLVWRAWRANRQVGRRR